MDKQYRVSHDGETTKLHENVPELKDFKMQKIFSANEEHFREIKTLVV